MSSLTTVKIKHEHGFVCQESLEKALSQEKISGIDIVEKEGKYFLSLSENVRNSMVQRTQLALNNQLNEVVQQILPTYTRLLAIKQFTSQKFKLVREKRNSNGEEELIFEKAASRIEGGKFQRLIITIRNDNTLTIDAHNFTGRSCLNATGGFESKIGNVIKREMKPESKIGKRIQSQTNTRERLRL